MKIKRADSEGGLESIRIHLARAGVANGEKLSLPFIVALAANERHSLFRASERDAAAFGMVDAAELWNDLSFVTFVSLSPLPRRE